MAAMMGSIDLASPELTTPKTDKKRKKEKRDKSEKRKRARDEEEAVVDTGRKHKKTKSTLLKQEAEIDGEAGLESAELAHGERSEVKQKHKKSKRIKEDDDVEPDETTFVTVGGEEAEEQPKSENKKSKKKKRRESEGSALTQEVETTADAAVVGVEDEAPKSSKTKKRSKKHDADGEARETPSKPPRDAAVADADAMDVDEPPAQASADGYQPPDMPPRPQFPFYTQTVSLYEPIYPRGWSQPVTSCEYQHLRHLKNRYVPSLRGVLLDYRNVALGDKPGRAGAARADEDSTMLKSLNEYAVGFGWITADVDLFVPSRGAWMEGSVNLQTEGHIGVVCFGRFNASVEARRLPPSWKWVSNEDPEALGMEETASVVTADDHGVVRQVHSTGFWVDSGGDKIKGRIRFRIRNFDVGMSGETSYLSLEGTMLDKESERRLVKEEAELAEQRKGKKGGRGGVRRRAPEFAMTRFEEDEGGADQTQVATA